MIAFAITQLTDQLAKLILPVWILISCSSILALLWLIIAKLYHMFISPNLDACTFCGYDTTYLINNICPECGKDPRAKKSSNTNRRMTIVVLWGAVQILLTALLPLCVPSIAKYCPTALLINTYQFQLRNVQITSQNVIEGRFFEKIPTPEIESKFICAILSDSVHHEGSVTYRRDALLGDKASIEINISNSIISRTGERQLLAKCETLGINSSWQVPDAAFSSQMCRNSWKWRLFGSEPIARDTCAPLQIWLVEQNGAAKGLRDMSHVADIPIRIECDAVAFGSVEDTRIDDVLKNHLVVSMQEHANEWTCVVRLSKSPILLDTVSLGLRIEILADDKMQFLYDAILFADCWESGGRVCVTTLGKTPSTSNQIEQSRQVVARVQGIRAVGILDARGTAYWDGTLLVPVEVHRLPRETHRACP
ncbi:MAG: hypothetical protein K1Y02_25015 [Candidatus Hydrogenedentes bacterium]|nr:hypothetical protein [Candidatus Hydrogenedentota bacterium]